MGIGRIEGEEMKEKLREATYFHSKMIEEQEDRDVFKFNLSAFLSSARSVMQYAKKEAESKKGGKKWYHDWMGSSPVLSFFKDKRDFNIHTAPISPRKHVNVTITEVLHFSESVHIVVRDKDGKVKETRDIQENAQPGKEGEPSVRSESRYEFQDWSGGENVIGLCEKYIKELERVVHDGVGKGFITE